MSRVIIVPPEVERVARCAVDSIFKVHRTLGPGLLESAYTVCIQEELRSRGIVFASEVAVPLQYGSRRLESGFRADLIVADSLLIELKAVETLHPVHRAQVITYLKLTNLPLGLLVNMNVPRIKDGIHRLFNPSLAS
jgi:GxxExxY protein